jgi:hypothetical protein
MGAELTDTFFASFTSDANCSIGKVDISVVHANELAHA